MGNKYFIKAYGCQMNFYEAGVVAAIMENAGYESSPTEYDADVIFLITCSVRNHAEQRALGRFNNLKGLKAEKPDLIIGILGCMAQNYKDVLGEKYGVDLVLGPDEYRKLPELINSFKTTRKSQIATSFSQENYEGIIPRSQSKVTGFISIMRGCNNFCSYCIVPYVRGRERSKSKAQIIKEAEHLINSGVKDITLVGQNVLAWHEDSLNFIDLIKQVDDLDGYTRLRFITSHPKDLTLEHFKVLASLRKFGRHIHLPLQSGSNRILKLMNRGYTKEEYIEKIEQARKIMPDISFTTDIMVGFPSETDADYQETLDVLNQLQFDFAYMFKYSERPNTKSCGLLPKVDDDISQKRLAGLIDLQNKITMAKSQDFLGKVIEVLVESKNSKQSFARAGNNKVIIINQPAEPGKVYQCRINKISGWTPVGTIKNRNTESDARKNSVQDMIKEGV